MASRHHHRFLVPALVLGTVALAGCGDDGDGASDSADDDGVVHVTMDDFHYAGLPEEIEVGTRIEVSNDSENEIHEFVAFRLDDDDDRSADEIVGGDLGALLGSAEPAAVLLAAPGGEQIPAIGDGTLTDPGRYLIVCVIPTGAGPDEYLEAAAISDGPPDIEGGPPHIAHGMYAEVTVTA